MLRKEISSERSKVLKEESKYINDQHNTYIYGQYFWSDKGGLWAT